MIPANSRVSLFNSSNDDKALLTQLLTAALVPASAGGGSAGAGAALGLPVLPLLSLIAEYYMPLSGAHTVVGGSVNREMAGICDGPARGARLNAPAVVVAYDRPPIGGGETERVFLIGDLRHNVIRMYEPQSDRVSLYAGIPSLERPSIVSAECHKSTFSHIYGICVDPYRPGRVYVCDELSVRIIENGHVAMLAGGTSIRTDGPLADGDAATARFCGPSGMLVLDRGETLLVADTGNNRLRVVSTKTGAVKTVAGSDDASNTDGCGPAASLYQPRFMAFDRTDPTRRTVYVTAMLALRKFNLDTAKVSTVPITDDQNPIGVSCTPSGAVIFTCEWSDAGVFVYDPVRKSTELLAASPTSYGGADGRPPPEWRAKLPVYQPTDVCVVDDELCAYVTDREIDTVKRIALPLRFFLPSS